MHPCPMPAELQLVVAATLASCTRAATPNPLEASSPAEVQLAVRAAVLAGQPMVANLAEAQLAARVAVLARPVGSTSQTAAPAAESRGGKKRWRRSHRDPRTARATLEYRWGRRGAERERKEGRHMAAAALMRSLLVCSLLVRSPLRCRYASASTLPERRKERRQ